MALVYASQLSDEPVDMKWLDHMGFRFTRNMHLLLCDELAIPLTGIVSNPFWHLTEPAEATARNALFSDGIIRPVAHSVDADAVEVINELLSHPDHLWAPTREQMQSLAETIRSCEPKYEVVLREHFRGAMYDNVGEVLARLNCEDDAGIVQPDSLEDLCAWHHGRRDEREAFRLSDLWSETNKRFGKGSAQDLYLRAAGSASYHYGMARQMFSCEDICAPNQYLRTIDVLRAANGEVLIDALPDSHAPSGYEIDLPLEAIAEFSLSEVVALRNETTFKHLRSLIRRVPGEQLEEAGPNLRTALNECNEYLKECNQDSIKNAMLRHEIKRRDSRRRDRIDLVSGGAGAGLAILGFTSAGAAVAGAGITLAVFVFGCRIVRYLQGKSVDAGGCTFRDSPKTTLNLRTLEQRSR